MWPSCNQQPTLIYYLVPPIEVWLSQPPNPREAGEGAKAGGVVTDFHPLRLRKPRPRETSQSFPSVGVIVNKSNATTGSQMANKRRITVTEAPLPSLHGFPPLECYCWLCWLGQLRSFLSPPACIVREAGSGGLLSNNIAAGKMTLHKCVLRSTQISPADLQRNENLRPLEEGGPEFRG